ncbi:MAG: DUF3667 domain-containing protein [Betaproteobacteria bacterium]
MSTGNSPPLFSRLEEGALRGACVNCDAPVAPAQKFCGQCAQKIPAHRLTVHEVTHDVLHAFLHVDHSVLSLVRALLVRPGQVAREYIAGHRKRYFSPFTFVIIVVGVASLALAASGIISPTTPDGRINSATEFLQRHVNLVILLQLPLLSLFSLLLFRSSGFHFAEHMVLAAYTSGMRSIVFTLVTLPVWRLLQGVVAVQWIIYGYLLVWAIYFGFASSQFHEGHRGWLWFKGFMAAALAHLTTTVLMVIAIFVYVKFFTG